MSFLDQIIDRKFLINRWSKIVIGSKFV